MRDDRTLHAAEEDILDLPIVDFFVRDAARRKFIVTFMPEDSVSKAEKEVVAIPENSSDGKRVALQLESLCRVWKAGGIERISHTGGDDFTFHFKGGKVRSVVDEPPGRDAPHEIYRCLQDIAMTAQVVFILRQRAHGMAAV